MGFPKSICVLVCCLLAVWSCKKPEDLTPPTLVVHTPTDGTHYNALDTIIIDLDVSDNNVVQTVSVELITQNSALALPGKSIVVCADNDHLVFQYPLNEIHLESGPALFAHHSVGWQTNQKRICRDSTERGPLARPGRLLARKPD